METLILDFLKSHGLNPFSVLYFTLNSVKLIKISFYINSDIEKFEELMDYRFSSDKSSLMEFNHDNTILIKGIFLSKLLKMIEEEWK